MPDGDIVHPNLYQAYWQPYTMLCEGQFSDERVAAVLLRVIKKRVRRLDAQVVGVINAVADVLGQARMGPLFDAATDWGQLCEDVTQAVQRQNRELKADRRMAALIEMAGKQQLVEQRNGVQAENLAEAVARKFLGNLYAAEFEGKVPLTDVHPNGIDQATMLDKLARLRPPVDSHLGDMAAYLVEKGTVKGMKCQRRQEERVSLSIDTALDDIGR